MTLTEINELYRNSDLDKAILHEIRGLIIPFDPTWKNIAVNVSGGADSAMLASSLAQLIQDNGYDCKVHFISFVRVWEFRPWAPFISQAVYDKIKSMFPTVIGNRIEGFIPTEMEEGVSGRNLINNRSGDRIFVQNFNKYSAYRYGLDAVYNATTLNPRDADIGGEHRPKDREIAWYNNKGVSELVLKDGDVWAVNPYRYTDKVYVINGYYKNGWLDLLELTRSCEGDKNTDPELFSSYLKYKHGESKLPLCGKCFWCLERDWATNKVINNET